MGGGSAKGSGQLNSGYRINPECMTHYSGNHPILNLNFLAGVFFLQRVTPLHNCVFEAW
jgi:hypothetical protein